MVSTTAAYLFVSHCAQVIDLWLYPLVTIIANLFISWTLFQSDVSEPA